MGLKQQKSERIYHITCIYICIVCCHEDCGSYNNSIHKFACVKPTSGMHVEIKRKAELHRDTTIYGKNGPNLDRIKCNGNMEMSENRLLQNLRMLGIRELYAQGGAPPVISWFIIPITIDITPINPSEIVLINQLNANYGAPPCRRAERSGLKKNTKINRSQWILISYVTLWQTFT